MVIGYLCVNRHCLGFGLKHHKRFIVQPELYSTHTINLRYNESIGTSPFIPCIWEYFNGLCPWEQNNCSVHVYHKLITITSIFVITEVYCTKSNTFHWMIHSYVNNIRNINFVR